MKEEQYNALVSANEYLYNLIDGVLDIIQLLDNDIKKAFDQIKLVCEGIDWLTQIIFLTREVQSEKIEINELNENLNNIVESLENEDYDLLKEIFEYELIPRLKDIHSQIQSNL